MFNQRTTLDQGETVLLKCVYAFEIEAVDRQAPLALSARQPLTVRALHQTDRLQQRKKNQPGLEARLA
jgi:hypothetical protein